ncbi:MAG: AF1514 family protein [Desulfobacca sp.]|uniref:AF1514 family protein n=1 Tax=Desulfobacca sp. TaxID=2067990 RepID=UPI00404B3FD7
MAPILSSCPPLRREMLPQPVDVSAPAPLSWSEANRLATEKAHELHGEVMLVAWFDRHTGESSPALPCCQEDKPGWLAYALSRGADLIISINGEAYVFAFKKL